MKAIINKKYLLEKFPGKGGWTFARIPQIKQDKKNPFGWVKVKGIIDGYAISQYKLMPMGNGQLFLPVKAGIRKIIGKQAGDYITVTLYPDNDPVLIPAELLDCLKDDPDAHRNFIQLSEGKQKEYIDWIYEAKKESTRIERMATMITTISKG
ncbi:MAG TPA: hypothetical protein DHW64_00565 [Chitinophagaceae bacterium]|jgi:hypothetical protein|nr:hypothetical protein [Chitinophagaceae bacterium]